MARPVQDLAEARAELSSVFSLKDAGQGGGLEWLEATPKNRDTTFERIRMGFKGDVLGGQMELFDFFGQRTTLKLSRFARNPAIAPSRFKFTPPKGAHHRRVIRIVMPADAGIQPI